MKRFILIFCIVLMIGTGVCSSQTPRLFTSDRLSSNLITCICQDKAGYLWIGTEYGLNKFDGYRFTTYLHDDADTTTVHDNSITSMFVDRNGNLVVGSSQGASVYDYDNNCFHILKNKYNPRPHFSHFIQFPNGKLLACTAGFGLFTVNIETMTLYPFGKFAPNNTENFFNSIYLDRNSNLWKIGNEPFVSRYRKCKVKPGLAQNYISEVGIPQDFITTADGTIIVICQHGLMRYDERNDKMMVMDINYGPIDVNALMMDCGIISKRGDIYIGTLGNGVFCIRKGTNMLTTVGNDIKGIDLTSTSIRALCEDREHNLWVGCNKKGLLFMPSRKARFTSWNFSQQNMDIGGSVTSICKGENGITWCAVQNNGIYGFDSNGMICAHPKSPSGTNIIYRDSKGSFWIGADNGLYSYTPYTGTFKLEMKIDGESVNAIADDGQGKMFVSDFGKGMKVFDSNSGTVSTFNMFMNDPKRGHINNNWIMTLCYDKFGMLWIGNTAGLMLFTPQTNTFQPTTGGSFLEHSTCNSFYEMVDGNMMIGTNAGLYIFDRMRKEARPYSGAGILRNKVINSIVKDHSGDLWFSTSMGIWQYSKEKKKYTGFINGNGLVTHEYGIGAFLHTSDDRIYYGNSDGLTTFYPNAVKNSERIKSELMLTNLFIGIKPVNCSTLSNGSRITGTAVEKSDHFTISYIDNTFSMEFSLMEYGYAENVIYEYRLNDNEEWTSTEEGKNSITFSHLQPGSYTLEVRACVNGSYSAAKTYHITITPPWYLSTTAYLLYIILGISIALYIFYTYNRRRREELYEEKMKFLINATHDIRSPLTLIMGPLHKLMKKDFDDETKGELNVIERNAKRILKLVNQILDIRKLDKNQMNMHCTKTNMVGFIEGIFKNYEFRAKEIGIEFTFEHSKEPLYAWIDRINFDKVISNLLSNAFKYTFGGGEITIKVTTGHNEKADLTLKNYMEIKVIDNGIGLKEAHTEKIFERFYQGSNGRTIHIDGTGIGLNLCKMIVELHHGTIEAENRTDSQGTCMTVRIPLGCNHLTEEELLHPDDMNEESANKKKWNNSRHKILIVDDDKEIGDYISSELGEFFKFKICYNGKEALNELLKNEYDLVISDVMMPEMDGFTFVRKVKSNSIISHIPVILLTSKSDIDNRMTGFEKGADAYIAKPFDMEELHVVINNLISSMLRLKGKFSGAQKQEGKITDVTKDVVGNDDQLMQRIVKSVNKNLSDSDFDVEMLSEEVGLSRAQLHRKMKEMTGIPAGEFIRNLRLEQAAKLLSENKVNVTQVAYTVGFNNQTHFSTVFRKHYGMSPKEYTEKHKEKE